MNNYHHPELRAEITNPIYKIEQNSFLIIKLSLDLPIGPIRKCLLLFYLYLSSLFGPLQPPTPHPTQKPTSYIRITPQLMELVPVHKNLGGESEVEKFYKRHIVNVKDNPIPQVLVVAILRILLTTCPNANRGSGGIDLHREWISSVSLCVKYPQIYKRFIDGKADDCPLVHDRIIQLYTDGNDSGNKSDEEFKEKDFKDSDDSENDSNSNSDSEEGNIRDSRKYLELFTEGELDLAVSELFNFENYRHSLISAKFIGQLLFFIQRHFQYNHAIQGIYFSSLIVDANGIKVLLKFLNQNFHGPSNYLLRRSDAHSIICSDTLPSLKESCHRHISPSDSTQITAYNNEIYPRIKYILHNTIRPILFLMHAVAFGQQERIEQNLIHFKAIKIMSRIAENFSDTDNKMIAYQIIKIQIMYIKEKGPKNTSSGNIMKAISKVYENVQLEKEDMEDWIKMTEDGNFEAEELNHKELGEVCKEFHINHYWSNSPEFQEQMGEDSSEEEVERKKGLRKCLKVKNEYYRLFLEAPDLTDEQKENYLSYI